MIHYLIYLVIMVGGVEQQRVYIGSEEREVQATINVKALQDGSYRDQKAVDAVRNGMRVWYGERTVYQFVVEKKP